jgi:6-phosphogluconolactonase (cycloisomerase 2 family)
VRFYRLAVILAVSAVSLLTGCSKDFFTAVTGGGAGSGTTFLYVTNTSSTTGTVSAYSVSSGVLTQLSGSPYTLPAGAPTSVVVAPNNKFLFVGSTTGVFLYTINSDGTLTIANNGTVVYLSQSGTTTTVQSMAVDSTDSWLIVANQGVASLDAVNIDPTTGLTTSTPTVTARLNTGVSPQQVAISPNNGTVFVALGANGVEAISFTASSGTPWANTGKILPIAKANGADNALTVDTTSNYLLVAEATSNIVRSIKISDMLAGTDTETTMPTGVNPAGVLADLSGAYVYVSNATDNSISGYTISTGTLTQLTDSPFTSAKSPGALVEDSSKTYVATISTKSNPNLWLYTFDSTTAGDLDIKTTTSTASSTTSIANGIAATH